jgi:SAM-dependent methyltransferase
VPLTTPSGYASAFVATWRAAGPGLGVRDAAELLLRPLRARAERRFDRRFGTDTAATSDELGPGGDYAGERAFYQPITPAAFRAAASLLPREVGGLTFVDFGSGKGRALLLAAEHGFGRVVGVELSAGLHEAARRNVAAYERATGRAAPIELVHDDALAFEIPAPEPCVLYLYNPFPEPVTRRLLDRIAASRARSPRAMYLVYMAPRFDHLVARHGFWRPLARRRFALTMGAVYESGP